MMMALHSILNTATSFLEMSEYFIKLLQSIITQNDHRNHSFLHAKEHVFGRHICGDFCLVSKSYKYTVFTGVYLQIHPGSFLASALNSGARHNVYGPQVFCWKQKVTGWKKEATFTIDSYTCHERKYNFSYLCFSVKEKWQMRSNDGHPFTQRKIICNRFFSAQYFASLCNCKSGLCEGYLLWIKTFRKLQTIFY